MGVLPEFERSAAVAINPSGQIVGYNFRYIGVESETVQYRAFSWTEADGMRDLGTLGGDDSWATDVNANGQVVGFSTVAPQVFRAFSWTAMGGMVDLGTLPGGVGSKAIAVNRSGHVVGFSWAGR